MNKTTIVKLILAAVILVPLCALAQGTLQVSNLGQTPTGSAAIGSDSWIAQEFITGNNPDGYTLDSVQLLMNAASETPAGFTVSLYSKTGDPHSGSNGDSPLADIGNLNGSADPSSGGLFAYASAGLLLSSHTFYFVVVTSETPVADGSYNWSAAYRAGVGSSTTGWSIQDYYYSSLNGSTWSETIRQDVFQMGIYATPVPEPSTVALLFLGGIFILSRVRMKSNATKPNY
jgi:hypothetical protein